MLTAAGCGDDGGDDEMDGGTDAATDGPPADAGPGCFTVGRLDGSGEGSPPPDGIGGGGDLAVETDTLRAVFAAVDRPAHLATSGGTLIDLHLLGRSDHMNEYSQLAGLGQAMQVRYTEMEVAEQRGPLLVVEVRGYVLPQPPEEGEAPAVTPDPGENVKVTTRYELRCGEPRVWLESTMVNEGDEAYMTDLEWTVLDVMFWGTRSLLPFCPAEGQGDECNPFTIADPLSGLVRTQYVGATGSVVGDPGSFAFYVDDPDVDTLTGVHDDQVSAFGEISFSGRFLAPGDTRTARRAIVVGDGADVASAADVALDALAEAGRFEVGTASGSVTAPGGEALPEDPFRRPLVVLATPAAEGDPLDPEAWTPVTTVRAEADGGFSARVPAGPIAWELRSPGREPKRGMGGTVEAGGELDLGALALEPLPELRVEVRDVTGGAASSLPARVIVRGSGDTPDPDFGPTYGGSPARDVALTDGEGDVALGVPEGSYDVWATHGPMWTIAHQEVTVDATGADVRLELQALDVLPDGFVTADFHVHSAASMDSSLPITDRVRAFLAEGVQAVVSTDHDVVFDYAPALATVEETLPPSWVGAMRTFVGLESTTTVPQPAFPHTVGHHNAFPLTMQVGAHKNGAPVDEYLDVGTLYERLRAIPSPVETPLLQLNHGRAGTAGSIWLGYFDSCGFDPTMPLDPDGRCFSAMGPMGTRPWDFDAMEVVNGKNARNFVDMSRDWYALLRQAPDGRLPVGTANSDSHRLVIDQAGYPMTVLQTGADLDALDDAALVETMRDGAVSGALGVFVWTGARPAGTDGPATPPGKMPVGTAGGEIELDVRVTAPPWVPVEEVRILVGGEVAMRLTVADGDLVEPADPMGTADLVRYEDTIVLGDGLFDSDTFVTVEAGFALPPVADLDGDGRVDATDNDGDGDVDMDDLDAGGLDFGEVPMPMGVIAPGARPIGYTNPIFVDGDGNGSYDPIGTPLPD